MPREVILRKINEILRLRFDWGLSRREIFRSMSVSRSTVADYLLRASVAGLSWPLPEGLGETAWNDCCFRRQQGTIAGYVLYRSDPRCTGS